MTKRQRRQRTKKTRPLYVCLNHALLLHVPIRHRNDGDRKLVSPFEFALAAGLNAVARCEVFEQYHRSALESGSRAIKHEAKTGARTIERYAWNVHVGVVKRTDKRQAFQEAGSSGYQRVMRGLKDRLPFTVAFETTRTHLLSVAGLPTSGQSLNKLEAALNRLRRPVGGMPPLIEHWEELPSGRLWLEVSTAWMQKPYGRVPVPLPSARAPRAQALYCLLFTLRTTAANQDTISLVSLCQRIGVSLEWGATQASQVITRALAAVNRHLATLDADALEAAGLRVPASFEIVSEDGRIRFQKVNRPRRDDEDVDVDGRSRAYTAEMYSNDES
jgi:hypothetical protein